MSRYVFTVQARLDIKEINKFIARENPQAATRFVDAVEHQVQGLSRFSKYGTQFRLSCTLIKRFFDWQLHNFLSLN